MASLLATQIGNLLRVPLPMLPVEILDADDVKAILLGLDAKIEAVIADPGGGGGGSPVGVDLTLAPWSADKTGALDCSPVLTAILAAGFRTVWFPKGKYRFNSQVPLPAGTKLIGESYQTVEIDARDVVWVDCQRNTDPTYTLDWSRCEISGFTIDMDYGGITVHGHESRLSSLRFRGGQAGRWCIKLHAANECAIRDVSAGYGGGSFHRLVANGILIYAEDVPGESTVNYGDSTLEEISLKGDVANWIGIKLEHQSTSGTIGLINNITLSRIQCQAPAAQGHADAVAAGSVYAYNGSVGVYLHRVARCTFIGVDVEGTHTGFYASGTSGGLGAGATKRNVFLGCQAFNSTNPWTDTNSSLDGSVGQNLFLGGQEFGPIQPVGFANGDPNNAYTGRRSTYDMLLPGGLWFARPGNGQFKGALRFTDDEALYLVHDSQDAGGEPYAGMPKYQTPAKALGFRVGHSVNEAHLFKPRGYTSGREHRIKIGNGPGFTLGTTAVGPLHRVEIADPLYLSAWTGSAPGGLGSSQIGVMINAGDAAAIGSPSTGRWTGPGVYRLANAAAQGGSFAAQWLPIASRPGATTAHLGRAGTAYTVDRDWFDKTSAMANASDCTITIPADLIRSDEEVSGAVHKAAAIGRVRRGAAGRVTFAAGSGVTLYTDGTTSSVATVSIPRKGQTVEFLYVRTGAGTAEVHIRDARAPAARLVKTSSFTMVESELEALIRCEASDPTTITVTIPASALPAGLDYGRVTVARTGTGAVTLAAGSGATLRLPVDSPSLPSQWATVDVVLERTGTSTVDLLVIGLAAAGAIGEINGGTP